MPFPPAPPSGVQHHSVSRNVPAGITVLVVDPHCVVREGVKVLVNAQPGMRVVGEAADGSAALALAEELNPDVVVTEVNLPELDGAQVAARLREARPDGKVLILTACEHRGSARLLLGMGARGYVLKRSPAERLIQALGAVASGGIYLDPEVAGGTAGDVIGSTDGGEKSDVELSDREVQVLRLIALGYSNKEIAARLKLSVKTIETYKTRSTEKLKLPSRVDIVRHAARCGWLTDSDADPVVIHDTSRPGSSSTRPESA